MKDFRLKLIFIVSFLFSISCTNNKNTAINILYLFDISGSYHKKSLKESLEISWRFLMKLLEVMVCHLNHKPSSLDN